MSPTAVDVRGEKVERPDPIFSNDVLIGNWYEDRFSNQIDRHAITPGIYGESGCIKDLSSYRENYKTPKTNIQRAADEFRTINQAAFANRLHCNATNILLFNGDQFEKNMTTMMDIMFRIKPKAAGNMGEVDILKKKPKEDLLKSYGNATVTGYSRYKALQSCCDKNIPITSTYRREYKYCGGKNKA